MTRLRFAPAHRGGLLVDAPHEYRCASLRLCVEGLGVASAYTDEVILPWSARGFIPGVGDQPRHHWLVQAWSQHDGMRGVALRVEGDLDAACDSIWRATCVGWRRVHADFDRLTAGRSIPVVTSRWGNAQPCWAELGTLDALTHVLAKRADLRERLRDSERVARLAVDMADGLLPALLRPEPALRDKVDARAGLRSAGFFHRYGRPLSYSELPSLSEVVAKTRAAIAANRYRGDRALPSDEVIADVARRWYLEVRPWPFSALVDD